jgi:hypothetical protein
MPHLLKNENLEIYIDLPNEGYRLSRFDWTGKITTVKYKGRRVSSVERTDVDDKINYGRGFYNEFGIEDAVGFDETKVGEWFHKIGVGILKKNDSEYGFFKNYEIKPASFNLNSNTDSIELYCVSDLVNGYGYILRKTIELLENGFTIHYRLNNTGKKTIQTDEYNHNFVSIDHDLISENYKLSLPFTLDSSKFKQYVNEEEKVKIFKNEIGFSGTPKEPFFFSDLTASKMVNPSWDLVNSKKKLRIQEIADFESDKINLWGWNHVVSPEIFFKINLKPNDSVSWTRSYNIHEIN